MLQIASGKLFRSTQVRRNNLRGVLHTNVHLHPEATIQTAAGRLLPTDFLSSHPGQLVYEITEHIEGDHPSPAALVSHTVRPYLRDFAAIVSLGFNATCTLRAEDTLRLVSPPRNLSSEAPPRSFIPRVFDEQVCPQDDEIDHFVKFVNDLIALRRESFLAAMRAIRTYVAALHRLGDDLDVAYTLFVASIESLAQGFDDFQPRWGNYESSKRLNIDSALDSADKSTARRVRQAVLKNEKLSLARRFREFALAHVEGAYFRSEADGIQEPVSRTDLEEALREAYDLRSRYIHNLRKLPGLLSINASPGETVRVEGSTLFTFRGISRLVRHVIAEFVARQPKEAKEEYDYSSERHGVVQVELAPEYWVGRTENVRLADGTKRLEGFLMQLSSYLVGVPNAKVTDLRPLLTRVEGRLSRSREENRRPFLALYALFNELAQDDEARTPNYEAVMLRFGKELSKPSIEGMLVHLMRTVIPEWSLEEYVQVLEQYLSQRNNKGGLRLPRTFEAGLFLDLAEQYRRADRCSEARTFLGRATESHPGHQHIREMEEAFDPARRIDWFQLVFPVVSIPDA